MDATPDPLEEIDCRHAQLLDQLDELNARIEAALDEHGRTDGHAAHAQR